MDKKGKVLTTYPPLPVHVVIECPLTFYFIGIRTGSSKVSVRLASKSYSDVPPAEITVMVVANLFLVPNFAFVMNGATVHYHAERSLSESNGVRYIFHICFSLLRAVGTCLQVGGARSKVGGQRE